jgi:type IV secretory pathway VirB3-like protein
MTTRRSNRLADLGAILILLALPLGLFWTVTLGSKTLLPVDNLYQWEPYRSFAELQGVPYPPHNALLSDLVLQNLAWKRLIVKSLQAGELPLWNPFLFTGVPFLAAGQHSALYPFSVLFYVLPLTRAYGLFMVLQLWLAGAFMYLFVRVLRQGRFPALIAGITYQLCAFFLVSVVHPMIVAAGAWLPLLLVAIELMIRKQEEGDPTPQEALWPVLLGAVALGLHVLAGHPEILFYTLVVMAYYAVARLAMLWHRGRAWQPVLRLAAWLVFMVALGLSLGAIQLIPMVELARTSFREGFVTYADVVSWAYPPRQIITFLVPDFFGNPAHHGYWDLVARLGAPADDIFWGTKNYVEAGSYVGILPLALAAVAVIGAASKPKGERLIADRRHIWLFSALAYLSLLLAFGTPLYAVLYYGLPGVKQLHSPFRWVFPYTLSVAVLAGFGARQLVDLQRNSGLSSGEQGPRTDAYRRWLSALTGSTFWAGAVLVTGLVIVLIVPGPFVPIADRLLDTVPEARQAFTSGQMFLSYQWRNLLILGLMLTASGVVLHFSCHPIYLPLRVPIGHPLAMVVIAADLLLFGWGFHPAADPAWLEFTPPAIEFLKERASEGERASGGGPWRLTTFQVAGGYQTLNANIPWLHGLQDVRGYDSIIPRQYVEFMTSLEGQGELPFNRIAPIYGAENLSSPLLDLLNVRYVVTEGRIPNPDYDLIYEGEARIYENIDALPRAFALPRAEAVSEADLPARLRTLDPRQLVLLDRVPVSNPKSDWPLQPAQVVSYTLNTVLVDVVLPGPGWLVLADSYFPGWRAYRSNPQDEMAGGAELEIVRANGNFRAVWLGAGAHRVRFQYSPTSFNVGLYASLAALVVVLLLALHRLRGRFP